ncbi:MAG: sugar phosphate isomerase/epimerase [Bryobacteraceae bacterium]|nr:sugar phosphate isomerase/epimerase [Bryobacteraceae bacterium]MDW8376929.1 sugar phosphate isomerase/epimerase [Bryobacterales bacterium]
MSPPSVTRRSFLATAAFSTGMPAATKGFRPGCQTNAWRIQPENFQQVLGVVDKIKRYGYKGFETGFRNVQGQFENPQRARSAFDQRRLEFLGCHIFLLEYDPSTQIAPESLYRRVSQGAAALGAKRLILSGGTARNHGKLDGDLLRRKADALNHAGELCKKFGLVVAYHNHDKEFAQGGEEMEELLRLTDPASVRLILDAGHAWRAGISVPEWLDRHANRVDGIHLRDFRNGEQVPLGQGDFDLLAVAQVLRARNWSGWLINEEERLNDIKPGDAAVAPARRHLRKVFGV